MADISKAVWPGWETVRVIGSGSFGSVYEIRRNMFGKEERAALKVISIPSEQDEIEDLYSEGYDDASITAHLRTYLEDIVREYSLMLDIKGHTNVVYCDDLRYTPHEDGIGWDIFIKMELLTPLTKSLEKEYDEQQTLRLGVDLCNALVLCKQENIVHRDIKPQNIFVSKTGDYKLGDFGVAKVAEKTASGTKVGTFEYMAPEIYNNQPYGGASDIYALGLVLYWMMNERRTPFQPVNKIPSAGEKEEARKRRFDGDPIPAPLHGSEELKQIVLKACSFEPQNRFESPEQMRQAMRRLLKKEPAAGELDISGSCIPPVSVYQDDEEGTIGIGGPHVPAQPDSTPRGEQKYQPEQMEYTEGTVGVFGKKEETADATSTGDDVIGQKTDETVPEPAWEAPVQEEPVQEEQQEVPPAPPAAEPPVKPGKSKKKTVAIVAVVLLVLAAIGFLAEKAFTKRGWVEEEGKTYFYVDGEMQTGRCNIEEKYYFFKNDGTMATGWIQDGNSRYYAGSDGVLYTGRRTISGDEYWFGTSGILYFDGFFETSDGMFYADESGILQFGFLRFEELDEEYYIGHEIGMVTGWAEIEGNTYYFEEIENRRGRMVTGWLAADELYYFDENGIMATGWQTLDGNKYYFGTDGAMVTGKQTIDGEGYFFDEYGVLVPQGWREINGNTYYYTQDGQPHVGWLSVDGAKYYMDSSGIMTTGGKKIDGSWYYFDSDGKMATGETEISGKGTYFFGSDGKFSYRHALVKNLDWETSSVKATFINKFGVGREGYFNELNQDVVNCVSMKISVEITDVSYGDANGEWGFYIRDLNDGQWKRITSFTVSDNNSTSTLTFDEPISFSAFKISAYGIHGIGSVSFRQGLTEVKVLDYNFE